VRTRHNNLRCFPRCSDPHSPTSFCGQCLSGRIHWETSRDLPQEVRVIGAFRNLSCPLPLSIGQIWNGETSDVFIIGSCLPISETLSTFTFIPNRKWQYSNEDRIVSTDLHVFTAFLLENNQCVAMADSNSFHVTPVWTADKDKESQRRTRARLKRKELSRQIVEDAEEARRKLPKIESQTFTPSPQVPLPAPVQVPNTVVSSVSPALQNGIKPMITQPSAMPNFPGGTSTRFLEPRVSVWAHAPTISPPSFYPHLVPSLPPLSSRFLPPGGLDHPMMPTTFGWGTHFKQFLTPGLGLGHLRKPFPPFGNHPI